MSCQVIQLPNSLSHPGPQTKQKIYKINIVKRQDMAAVDWWWAVYWPIKSVPSSNLALVLIILFDDKNSPIDLHHMIVT
jgi:hypothetical protein